MNCTATARVEGGYTAFNASLLPDVQTRASTDVPDHLYNLEIRQYDAAGNHLTGKDYGTVTIGTRLEVALNTRLPVGIGSSWQRWGSIFLRH